MQVQHLNFFAIVFYNFSCNGPNFKIQDYSIDRWRAWCPFDASEIVYIKEHRVRTCTQLFNFREEKVKENTILSKMELDGMNFLGRWVFVNTITMELDFVYWTWPGLRISIETRDLERFSWRDIKKNINRSRSNKKNSIVQGWTWLI